MLATAPDSLLAVVRKGRKPRDRLTGQPAAPLDLPHSVAWAREYLLGSAKEAVEGSYGDLATVSVAMNLRDRGISVNLAIELMAEHWNYEKATPPWDLDDLEKKIHSAYSSASEMRHGGETPEAEFDVVEIAERVDLKVTPRRERMYRVEFDEAAALATSHVNPALIDDILDQHSFAVIYGPSNSGKTFLALSLAYHIAEGLPWAGHEVARGAVLYVVAEGGRGINKRIAALKKHYSPAGKPPLDIVPCPVDMRSSDADVKRIVKLAIEAAEAHGLQVVLIVVDTLSRALAGGDENASTDMGAFVMNVDKLRLATSATVLVVHHTGKNLANGARGWSGLRAAIDTEIEVGEGGVVSFEKQRDMEMLPDIRFRLVTLSLGEGPNGKQVTSCVLQIVSEADAEFEAQLSLSPIEKTYFDCLVSLGDGPATIRKWDAAFDEFLTASQQTPLDTRTKQRYRRSLEEAGWVERIGNASCQAKVQEH